AWPRDRPYSLAQTLTSCNAPKRLVRSWLRGAVLPSTANTGCPRRSLRPPWPARPGAGRLSEALSSNDPSDGTGLHIEGLRRFAYQVAPRDKQPQTRLHWKTARTYRPPGQRGAHG